MREREARGDDREGVREKKGVIDIRDICRERGVGVGRRVRLI